MSPTSPICAGNVGVWSTIRTRRCFLSRICSTGCCGFKLRIPQMRNLIKPTNCFPKQAKDFNLHVVKTFNEVVDLALHRHADAVNPFQELEHPTQGWPLGWLVDLVGEPLVLTRQLLAQSALHHRIDEQR